MPGQDTLKQALQRDAEVQHQIDQLKLKLLTVKRNLHDHQGTYLYVRGLY